MPVLTCPDLSGHTYNTGPCTLVSQCHFLHFRTLLFFSLTSYPAEIAYFNSPNWELFNSVRVMALYWSKIGDPSRSPCWRTVQRKSFERGNFCLTSCPSENCIFQLSKSIAFHWHTACRPATKKNCRSFQRRTIMFSRAKFFEVFRQKIERAVIFLSFGKSCWNCIFKRPRWIAF